MRRILKYQRNHANWIRIFQHLSTQCIWYGKQIYTWKINVQFIQSISSICFHCICNCPIFIHICMTFNRIVVNLCVSHLLSKKYHLHFTFICSLCVIVPWESHFMNAWMHEMNWPKKGVSVSSQEFMLYHDLSTFLINDYCVAFEKNLCIAAGHCRWFKKNIYQVDPWMAIAFAFNFKLKYDELVRFSFHCFSIINFGAARVWIATKRIQKRIIHARTNTLKHTNSSRPLSQSNISLCLENSEYNFILIYQPNIWKRNVFFSLFFRLGHFRWKLQKMSQSVRKTSEWQVYKHVTRVLQQTSHCKHAGTSIKTLFWSIIHWISEPKIFALLYLDVVGIIPIFFPLNRLFNRSLNYQQFESKKNTHNSWNNGKLRKPRGKTSDWILWNRLFQWLNYLLCTHVCL